MRQEEDIMYITYPHTFFFIHTRHTELFFLQIQLIQKKEQIRKIR